MTETAMTAAGIATAQGAPGAWSYESAFARDVNRRFNPGGIASTLRALAQENGDFDEVVEAFWQERRDTSWFFDPAERVRTTQLAKTRAGLEALRDVFLENGLSICLICEAVGASTPGAWEFVESWPLLPYQVDALHALVEGISGIGGVKPLYRGGRGAKALADHAVGELRGAPATALVPAWVLFDACLAGNEYAAPIRECERMAESGRGNLVESDVRTLKTLAVAPFLSDAAAMPRMIAALMADDVRFEPDGLAESAGASLERLVSTGFAYESGSAYEFARDAGGSVGVHGGITEIFGVRAVTASPATSEARVGSTA